MIDEERSLDMAARALIELFGDQAPDRARQRASEYPATDESDGRRFWMSLAEKIESMLDRKDR